MSGAEPCLFLMLSPPRSEHGMYVRLCLLIAHAPLFLMNSHKFPCPFHQYMSAPNVNFPFKTHCLIFNLESQRWSLYIVVVGTSSPQVADLLNKATFLSSQHLVSG